MVRSDYLVKDTLTDETFHKIREQSPGTMRLHIILVDRQKDSYCFIRTAGLIDISRICNFPNFASKWKIPENGCKVYFTGALYESCEYQYTPHDCCGIEGLCFNYDFVLTSLELAE